MGTTFTLRLGDFDAERLNAIALQDGRSKTDLITEGLRSVFASRLDSKILWLPRDEFDACMKVITEPEKDKEILARRQKLRTMKPVWED